MSIGELWNPDNWDDEPVTDDEIAETLEIHRRHKDDEGVRIRPRSERSSGGSSQHMVRGVHIH